MNHTYFGFDLLCFTLIVIAFAVGKDSFFLSFFFWGGYPESPNQNPTISLLWRNLDYLNAVTKTRQSHCCDINPTISLLYQNMTISLLYQNLTISLLWPKPDNLIAVTKTRQSHCCDQNPTISLPSHCCDQNLATSPLWRNLTISLLHRCWLFLPLWLFCNTVQLGLPNRVRRRPNNGLCTNKIGRQ